MTRENLYICEMDAGRLVLQAYNDELRSRTRALLDPANREAANREEFERAASRMLQPRWPVDEGSPRNLPPLLRRTGRLRKQLDKVERVVTRCGRVASVMALPLFARIPTGWCDMVAAMLRDREDIGALVEQLCRVVPPVVGWQRGLVRVAELMGVELPVIVFKESQYEFFLYERARSLEEAGFRVRSYEFPPTFYQAPVMPLFAHGREVEGSPQIQSCWYPEVWMFLSAVNPRACGVFFPWRYHQQYAQIV